MIRIAVCGCASQRDRVFAALDRVHAERGGIELVVHLGAAGWAADEWAAARGVRSITRAPNREGGIDSRNAELLRQHEVAGVIAFEPLDKVSADFVERAVQAEVPVWRR